MPELPEVETTLKGLNILINKKVIKISTNIKKLRYHVPNNISNKFKDQKIISTERIAKYILIHFKNNFTIIIHLGMSGRLKIIKSNFTQNSLYKISFLHFCIKTLISSLFLHTRI